MPIRMPLPRRRKIRRPHLELLEDRQLLATVPDGFSTSVAVSGLTDPTRLTQSLDGRLWILEQGGTVVTANQDGSSKSVALTIPASSISSTGERGLLGIAFNAREPNDTIQPKSAYLYYTSTEGGVHNRISRWTIDYTNPSQPTLAGEQVLVDLEPLSGATNHNGGGIAFGNDGKLYVGVGDNNNSANSQSLDNRLGKILRYNADGTIPDDNPTNFPGIGGTTTGANRAIWSVGLRNPYTLAFKFYSNEFYINDVGQNSFEEIDAGQAGVNYGWPATEGDFDPATYPNFTRPVYAYAHGTTGVEQGFAITGGAFYFNNAPLFGADSPATAAGSFQAYPGEYADDYYFSDFSGDWINRIDPATKAVARFASDLSQPTSLISALDNTLLVLERGTGQVRRVSYDIPPSIPTVQINAGPQSQTVGEGASVTFTVSAFARPDPTYQWARAEPGSDTFVPIPGATGASYTINTARPSDSGARFRVVVANFSQSKTSDPATLTVVPGTVPTERPQIPSDFDGDGRSDIAVYLATAGAFAYLPSSSTTGQGVLVPFGIAGLDATLPAVADYDGDGRSDFAVYLTGPGAYAYRPSGGGPDVLTSFGAAGPGATIPTPGDFFGAGHDEVAAYLPSLGAFAIRPKSGGPGVIIPFGYAGAGLTLPAVGDYDGDGRDDIAAFLPIPGVFAIRPSAGGPDQIIPFGQAGLQRTIPIPGDYDGDGRTDLAVSIPGLALFAYRPSSGGADVLQTFGSANDGSVPLVGNYSGAGVPDFAFFYPPTADFAIRPVRTTGAPDRIVRFGSAGFEQSLPTTEPPGSVATRYVVVPLQATAEATGTPAVTVTKRSGLPRRPAVTVLQGRPSTQPG